MQGETRVETAWFLRLRSKYESPRSRCAFNLNLRPYNKGAGYKRGQSSLPVQAASRVVVTGLHRLLKANRGCVAAAHLSELEEGLAANWYSSVLVADAVGTVGLCSPGHQTHFEPLHLEINHAHVL